jgi:Copper transport outer membrane protein, MctB
MYNLRYHIASLVAVFLALTVGLLLGSIVVERGLLSSQQTTLVEGLQAEFDKLRTESSDLKAANDTLGAFASDAVPRVVSGVLEGRTILVLASPDTADTAARASEAVRLAGGTPAIAAFAGSGFSLSDAVVTAAVAKDLGVAPSSLESTQVMDALVAEWGTPDAPRPLTRAMIASGGLNLQGLAATATVQGIAIAAVYDGTPDPWAIRLARSMVDETRFAVGVDTTKRTDGSAKAARDAGLSGVDDIDTALGRVSFAWVLSGRASGLFGQGEGATSRYPSPLFGR